MYSRLSAFLILLLSLFVVNACAQTPQALSEQDIIIFSQRYTTTVLAHAPIDNDYSILLSNDGTYKKCVKAASTGLTFHVNDLITTDMDYMHTTRVLYRSFGGIQEPNKQTSGICFAIIDPSLQNETQSIHISNGHDRVLPVTPTSEHIYVRTWPIEDLGPAEFVTISLLNSDKEVIFRIAPPSLRSTTSFPGLDSTQSPSP